MLPTRSVLATILLLSAPVAASAQLAVMPKLGTPGLGVDLAYGVSDMIVLRGGGAIVPYEPEFTVSGIDWEVDIPATAVLAVDLHPGGSGFRVSGGAFLMAEEVLFTGVLSENVDIGGEEYTPSELGQLDGTVDYGGLSPFLSVGYGKAAGSGTGLFIELGAAFIGGPAVGLSHSGGNISEERREQLEDDLERETADIEEELEDASIYPILNIGVRIGLGG